MYRVTPLRLDTFKQRAPSEHAEDVMLMYSVNFNIKAEAMVTPRRKCRRPAMVTPKSYPYP